MGLETNLYKTKAMVCTPGFIWGKVGGVAYKRGATGEVETSIEQKKARVRCAICDVIVVASYLKAHIVRSHGIYVPQTRGVDGVGEGPTTYVVSSPKVLQELICPVPGCPEVAHSAGTLHENFIFCNFRSRVAVAHEGKEPLPRWDM